MLLLFQGSLGPVKGEMFTALVHMEGLLDLERELLASLNAYIVAEKERWVLGGSDLQSCG